MAVKGMGQQRDAGSGGRHPAQESSLGGVRVYDIRLKLTDDPAQLPKAVRILNRRNFPSQPGQIADLQALAFGKIPQTALRGGFASCDQKMPVAPTVEARGQKTDVARGTPDIEAGDHPKHPDRAGQACTSGGIGEIGRVLVLHKILPTLILPIGLSLGLLVLAGITRRWVGVGLAGILLFLASLPCVSEYLLKSLEDEIPELSIREAPTADAILVLSGILGDDRGIGRKTNWGEGFDRFEAGVLLWKADKAPWLVFTDPVPSRADGRETEGERLRREALAAGVPSEAMVLIGPIGNTADEAKLLARVAREKGWKKVILVTTAWHLPRAWERFRQLDIDGVPFPVDHRTPVRSEWDPVDWFPSAYALAETEIFMREWIGRWYYRLRDRFPTD